MDIVISAAIAAAIAGLCSIVVAILSQRPIKRRLNECERDRMQTHHLLSLFVGAIVGIVPEPERQRLLEVTADMAINEQMNEWKSRESRR